VVDQGEPVPEGFEPSPPADLLCCAELIEPTGFDLFDHLGEGGLEGVQGHSQHRTLFAFGCCGIPEFHTPILFKHVFDSKLFSQQNKDK